MLAISLACTGIAAANDGTAPPPRASVAAAATVDEEGAAPAPHGPVTGASPTVAASVFAQWLNDAPEDESLHRRDAALTAAQLRKMFYDMATLAAAASPDVLQARAQAEAAGDDVGTARGQRLPQVSLGAQTRAKTFGGPSLSPNDTNRYDSVSLNMQTTVFDWGSGRKNVQSSRQLAQAAGLGYRAALESNALDVCTTLLELGRHRTMTALGDAYVARMRTLVNMLAQIARADQGRRSEWVQAKAQLLSAMTVRDTSATQMRNDELKLRILLNGQHAEIPDGGRWPISDEGLKSLAGDYRDHPAVLQAKATAAAADLHAGSLGASFKPRVDWLVSKSAFRDAQGLQRPWQTVLQVSWPLFSGGANSSSRRAAFARAEGSHQQAASLERNYEYQLRDAVLNARDAFKRADDYGDLVNETLQVRKAMFEQWYQLGKRSLLDVLISETDHYNDQIGEVSSRFDGYEAVISAYAGAGKLLDWLSSSGENEASKQ
ncbi:hypothetical protein GCM10027066_05460 [Dyella jejuensis]